MSKARALADLLADGFVDTDEIADGAVTSAKVSNGAITAGKLASGAAASNLGNYVTSVNGQSGAVNISTSPTTAQVLAATAGASAGAVGTYVLAHKETSGGLSENSTIAGSSLRYSNAEGARTNSLAGTWRVMGQFRLGNTITPAAVTVCLRIS